MFGATRLRLLSLSSLAMMMLASSTVFADGAPIFEPGKHVYTMPEVYRPAELLAGDLAEIESFARSLHYQFYVVFVDKLGATDEGARALSSVWSEQSADYDGFESWLLLVSVSEASCQLLPGTTWRVMYGIDSSQLVRASQARYRWRQGRDVVDGVTRLISDIDAIVWEKVGQREHEEKRAKVFERRLERVRRDLQVKEARVADAVIRASRSPERDRCMAALIDAGTARQGNDVGRMLVADKDLTVVEEALRRAREREDRESGERLTVTVAFVGIGVFFLGVILVGARDRYRRLKEAQARYAEIVGKWKGFICRAYLQLPSNEERLAAHHLTRVSGMVAAIRDRVLAEEKSILTSLEAIAIHAEECIREADRGGFFRIGRIEQTIEALESDFEFDTGDGAIVTVSFDEFAATFSERCGAWRAMLGTLVTAGHDGSRNTAL